ncbi:MAG: glycosyltransferase family 2 protein [Flavobacteriaceae bacterium]
MIKIAIIIPAFNESKSIGSVLDAIPKNVDEVVVVDNGSTDSTAEIVKSKHATLLFEPKKGYGHACLKGMKYLEKNPPEIVVFLDGDFSDYPEELNKIVSPIINNQAEFVIGARVQSLREKGSMTPQQIFGNGLACFLMSFMYRSTFTDLGPFRAIGWENLMALEMNDKTYGWTVEMQLKVLRRKLSYLEVPVRYRKRIGQSKVSGTVRGTFMAGYKILTWIGKFYFSRWK